MRTRINQPKNESVKKSLRRKSIKEDKSIIKVNQKKHELEKTNSKNKGVWPADT